MRSCSFSLNFIQNPGPGSTRNAEKHVHKDVNIYHVVIPLNLPSIGITDAIYNCYQQTQYSSIVIFLQLLSSFVIYFACLLMFIGC